MAAPAFVQASTGATDATGAFTFTGVATGTIGHIVVVQILVDGTGAISWGTISGTNINNLAGTANVWTEVGIFNAGATPQQRIFLGRRTSASAAPTFAASANTSGDDVYGRMYEFSDVNAGSTLADVIENVTPGSTTSGAAVSGTIADAAVTTLGPDRLALNLVGNNDDNAVAAFTGETGGDWVEATAEYADATGTDGCIQLQTANMPTAGTVDGGTATNVDATDGWGVVGFALIGTTIVPPVVGTRWPSPALIYLRKNN